jgi:hypothetical protein
VKWFLAALLVAGCGAAAKHETISLQCLGFCSFANVNHDSSGKEGVTKEEK